MGCNLVWCFLICSTGGDGSCTTVEGKDCDVLIIFRGDGIRQGGFGIVHVRFVLGYVQVFKVGAECGLVSKAEATDSSAEASTLPSQLNTWIKRVVM